MKGFIDEANGHRMTGWVWDPSRPDQRVEFEVLEGDNALVRVVANQYRSDLRGAGIGDGRHAFNVLLNRVLPRGPRHELYLRCTSTGLEVPGSPIVIETEYTADAPVENSLAEAASPYLGTTLEAEATADDLLETPAPLAGPGAPGDVTHRVRTLPTPEATLESNIDFADWNGVRGWVWDPRQPDKRIALELRDGDALLAAVTADEYRPDLELAGVGDGRHGFSIQFSETLLPYARHVLHLRPIGSLLDVPTFPLVLTRDQAGFDTSVMRFVLSNIMAEVARAQKPEDLAPTIASLVEVLDQALSYYFGLAHDAAPPNPGELLTAAEFGPQLQVMIDRVQTVYPTISLEDMGKPVISIIIPVYNKFELTYNCVKSVIEQGAAVPFEIVIVDDCSRDETVLAAFVFGRGIRLVRNPGNSGFVLSCNRGFDAARGDYVVFLNNDTQVKPRWLDELYETLQRNPNIGIAGSKLLFPDGNLQECGGIIWRMGDGWNWGRNQAADDPRFSYMRDTDYVSGAALMIKSTLFAELGKFDEYYVPAYYEDTDLCFRVRRAGYRVVVQPVSEVVHYEGASAGTSTTGTGMKRFQAINHRKFFKRWKDTLEAHRFNGELPELEAERMVRQRALFIDDSVPEPDKDAGSNAAFQHMLSLQRLGYKVTFIPGDNMARIDPYTADLQRRGIECLYHPYYFSVEDVFRKQPQAFDLVYLHRYSNASKYAGMIRQHFPNARILYNVADLHFLRTERQAEVHDDAKLRTTAAQLRRLELGAMSFVDCVIVHSDVEAEMLHEIAPHIEVQTVPWTVELRDIKRSAAGNASIAFIGGYRHPPNVDAAKWATQNIMPLLRKQVPGIELLLVGSHMPAEISGLAAKDVIPLGFVPSLDSVFERVRITVAPLRYGAGLKGKVLESLATGVPCVMTSVAAEGVGLPEELQCLVADDPDMIAGRIARLCRDEGEYDRVVTASRAHIAQNYSPERIDALIREACGVE
ncbi:MAG: glycosyltransferase [Alphaproteobacteria bacterium]|nr:glycosyltransferase [Alphaproteobacteria bacterium]